jgi:hypothetical protein
MTHLKTLLATAAVLLLCALPAHSSEADALASIASSCEATWGTDFRMQVFCRKIQTEAYYTLHPVAPVVREPVQPAPAQPTPIALPPPPPQATAPVAPPTLSEENLEPLSSRLARINNLVRLSLPIAVRHCGSDATCRKDQTAAIHELASKETTIAKAIRNPTTYTSAVLENDTVNACKVLWRASEDFAAIMRCINDAAPTM